MVKSSFIRLLKNLHLLRSPRPSSLQRTSKYASLLRISGALHLDIFPQPEQEPVFQLTLMASQAPENINYFDIKNKSEVEFIAVQRKRRKEVRKRR